MGEISDALARAREDRGEGPRGTPRDRRPSGPVRSPASAPPPEARDDAAARRAAPPAEPEPETPAPGSEDGAPGSGPAAASLGGTVRTGAATTVSATPGAGTPPAHRIELPRDREAGWVTRACVVDPTGAAATRFRHLAVRLRSMLAERRLRSVLVTSAVAGEGKTTVSVNLALALSSVSPDERVALVDLDLRRGRIAEVVGWSGEPGITSVLAGRCGLDEIRLETDLANLDVFPVGPHVTDAHALLGAAADRLLRQLHARYDYVVLDGPPVLPVPDVPLLGPLVGGALVVAASGRSRHKALRELMELVPRRAILGVFLNEFAGAGARDRYGYYGYDAAPARERREEEA